MLQKKNSYMLQRASTDIKLGSEVKKSMIMYAHYCSNPKYCMYSVICVIKHKIILNI